MAHITHEGRCQPRLPTLPALRIFVVARLLEPIDKLLRQRASDRLASGDPGNDGFGGISHLLGYVDDISSCVYLHNLPFLCNTLKSLGASLGCFVNSSKTCIHTSCNGTSPLPLLHTINPTLSTAISTTIAEFSTRPHPTDKSAPAIPVKLTTGFRLLGHPVGSSTFATKFFTAQVNNIKECITSMLHSITDEQTQLRLFSQCLLQKLPHLLASDVLYNLSTDDPNPNWEQWNGPLTSAIEDIIAKFLITLLASPSTSSHAILISQLSLRAGRLGLLCPRTRATPDFVITMAATIRNATNGFKLHKDLLPFQLHDSITQLFHPDTNPDSLIQQHFHTLLPQIASVACPPSTPPPIRIQHFLSSISATSTHSRI